MIKVIKEKNDIEQLLGFRDSIISNRFIDKTYLRINKFKVILSESVSHFNEVDVEKLIRCFSKIKTKYIYAVATQDYKNNNNYLRFLGTKEDLLCFSNEYGNLEYLLISDSGNGLVYCTIDDYYVIAGTQMYLKEFSSDAELEAQMKFEEFVDGFKSESTRKIYRNILAHYEDVFYKVHPG